MAIIEGDELGTSKSSNGTAASAALLGKQVPEAISTVGGIVTGGELFPSENLVAVRASEAVTMERMRLIGNASLVDDTITFQTALGKLILVAGNTHIFSIPWDETLVSNSLLAHSTTEAFLMPLLATEFKLLHSSAEDSTTAIATSSKVVVIAIGTV